MGFQQFYLTFIVEFNVFSTNVFIASVQESRLFLIFFYIRRTRSMSRLTQLYPYFILLIYLYFNFYRQNQCVFQQFVSVFYRYIQCVFNNLIFILSPTSIYFQQFMDPPPHTHTQTFYFELFLPISMCFQQFYPDFFLLLSSFIIYILLTF